MDLLRGVFEGTGVQVEVAGDRIGAASALKLSLAGFQKAARTPAAVSYALADGHGVAELPTAEAGRMPADFLSRPGELTGVAAPRGAGAPRRTRSPRTCAPPGCHPIWPRPLRR
ncbi:hypothetical protein GCM10023083_11740 [Streptomyces phyllanthi]